MTKPRLGLREGLLSYAELIAGKIRAAAAARILPRQARTASAPASLLKSPLLSTEKLILIGASTGGTEAIREVLQHLPPDSPGVLIAQHMPAGFTQSFAQRLHGLCRIAVSEAVDGERILPGHAYIAPGGFHLALGRSGANYVARVDQSPPVNRHRPSVDVLFDSGAVHAGKNAIGLILTGMGRDGAEGLLRLRQSGAHTLAQDEASCVVYGMPREAHALGAACEVLALSEMAPRVLAHLRSQGGMGNRV